MKTGVKYLNIPCLKLQSLLFLFVAAIPILYSSTIFADEKESNVGETRAIIEKWVQTRQLISKEKRDFEIGKEMINERIELVEREIESLRGKTDEIDESISDADKKRTELVDENETLKSASASLDGVILKLENKTKRLLAGLPDPLRERVGLLSRRLPENPKETKLSLGERFQNIVGILNETNKFNREIIVASEVRELDNGISAETTSMYIGVSHAFYSGGNGAIAGVGVASPEGWVWKPANDNSAEIAEAVSILKNEAPAAFVQLPIEIQ